MAFHRCQGLIARARGLIKVVGINGGHGLVAAAGLPVVVAGLSGAWAAPAAAQVAGQPADPSRLVGQRTQEVEQWIADLDAASLEVREQAQSELGDRGRCSLAALEDRFFDAGLSEEQRLRLHSAGLQLFCTTVRAAMGVNIS